MFRSAPHVLSTLLLSSSVVFAGTFSQSLFTDDASSGINSAVPYTSVADFQGTGTRVVNGVTFKDTRKIGNNYLLEGATISFPGPFANNVTGASKDLVGDFIYGGNAGTSTITLGGLTPGVQYTTTWYNVGFGNPGGRQLTIIPSDTNTPFAFDQNFSGGANGNLLSYTFTANAASISYTFDAVVDTDTFHYYAMTNSGSLPTRTIAPVSPVVMDAIASGGGAFTPFTGNFAPSNSDLLQTSVASITGSGDFAVEGTGGIPALVNGTFSITGVANNNPGLATGQNEAFITANLDISVNTFGYDISSIVGYGGWNDAGRDRQFYDIYVSYVGDPTFLFLGGVNRDPVGAGVNPNASRVEFTPGTPLTGIDSIRIEFPAGQENGFAGYGEFDVIGTASIPEPSTAILLLGGFAAAAAVRRARRRG